VARFSSDYSAGPILVVLRNLKPYLINGVQTVVRLWIYNYAVVCRTRTADVDLMFGTVSLHTSDLSALMLLCNENSRHVILALLLVSKFNLVLCMTGH